MSIFLNPNSRSSIVSAIKLSATQKSLSSGQSLHAHLLKNGLLPNTQLCNHLLNMYAKSMDFISARKLFDEMPQRNLVSLSTLISGFSQSDSPQYAFSLMPQLQKLSLTMNQFVFSSLVLACSQLKWIHVGKQIHAQVILSGFESDPFVRTSLLDMYSKSCNLGYAASVFWLSPSRDLVMYNSMISRFVNFDLYKEALELFAEGRRDIDLKPTEFTFGSLIKACSNLSRELAELLHALSIKAGFHADVFVGTSLVDMYGKFSDMESSKQVFQDVNYADLALYNSMIVCFSNNYFYNEAVQLFLRLRLKGFCPNECTFASILKACGGLNCVSWGKIIHGLLLKYVFGGGTVVAWTALIDMYMRCGFPKESFKLFNILPGKSTVLYNAMISGLGQHQAYEEAWNLYIDMSRKSVEPNDATFLSLMNLTVGQEMAIYVHSIKYGFGWDLKVQNAFLDSLVKEGFINEAQWLFNTMQVKDVVSWTSMISGLSEVSLELDAVELFKELKLAGVSPNGFTFSSVLKASGSLADLDVGKCIHGCSFKHGAVDDAFTNTSLLCMYAKCGALEECYKLFREMPVSNVVLWNTMIAACSQNGKGHEALELYKEMERHGVEPSQVSFTSLLSACSHSGLVEEGISIFELISNKHNMLPCMEHYACMVDMFGRARMLDRAKILIDNMPYKPDASIWKAFLAACKLHGNLGLGQIATNHILDLEVDNKSTLVSLSNINSELGKWDDVERLRRRIRHGRRKDAGLSWMQIKGG